MYFYKSLLESAGIQCLLSGELAEPSIGNVQLQVALPDEQRARELLTNEPPKNAV